LKVGMIPHVRDENVKSLFNRFLPRA